MDLITQDPFASCFYPKYRLVRKNEDVTLPYETSNIEMHIECCREHNDKFYGFIQINGEYYYRATGTSRKQVFSKLDKWINNHYEVIKNPDAKVFQLVVSGGKGNKTNIILLEEERENNNG